MTLSPEQLLTPIPGVCTALGNVSRTTVYELVNQHELVKVSIGRRSFITTESLMAYVDRLAEKAAGAGLAATDEEAAPSDENDEAASA